VVVKYSDIRSVPAKQREAIEMDITGIAKSHQADIHKAGKAHPSCRIPSGRR